MFDPSQADVRRFFCGAWEKSRSGAILSGIEAIAVDWIRVHPEYQGELVDAESAIAARYDVERGRTNPFLHLSMHLAISEQIAIDQPPGIRGLHDRLCAKFGDAHRAHHQIMECLGEVVWRAQRDATVPDNESYLDCLRRRIGD